MNIIRDRPEPENSQTLEFISKNVIYSDKYKPGENELNLENLMARLGGTKSDIIRPYMKIMRK